MKEKEEKDFESLRKNFESLYFEFAKIGGLVAKDRNEYLDFLRSLGSLGWSLCSLGSSELKDGEEKEKEKGEELKESICFLLEMIECLEDLYGNIGFERDVEFWKEVYSREEFCMRMCLREGYSSEDLKESMSRLLRVCVELGLGMREVCVPVCVENCVLCLLDVF